MAHGDDHKIQSFAKQKRFGFGLALFCITFCYNITILKVQIISVKV